MPLLQKWDIKTGVAAIWKIEEPESFFLEATGLDPAINNPVRRIEHLAGRNLLRLLAPDIDLQNIVVDEHGKPHLTGDALFFSISHSFPYIAVIINRDEPTGIDIQTIQPRITVMQHKFLSPAEQELFQNDTELLTLAWSAKEAVYKWYGKRNLEFIDNIPIVNFNKLAKHSITILFNVNNKINNIFLHNIFYADFVCTYVFSATE